MDIQDLRIAGTKYNSGMKEMIEYYEKFPRIDEKEIIRGSLCKSNVKRISKTWSISKSEDKIKGS